MSAHGPSGRYPDYRPCCARTVTTHSPRPAPPPSRGVFWPESRYPSCFSTEMLAIAPSFIDQPLECFVVVRLRICSERELSIGFEYLNVDRFSDRHHMEFWLVTLVRICRTLTNSRLAPKQIKLRHFRPEMPPDVRSHLGCDIDFGAGTDEIVFPATIGALPVVGAAVHLN